MMRGIGQQLTIKHGGVSDLLNFNYLEFIYDRKILIVIGAEEVEEDVDCEQDIDHIL